MPLPLILAGAALLAGGYGVKKGIDAKSDFDSAKYWNQKAQETFDEAKNKLEIARNQAQNSMQALGTSKFNIYKNSIIPFVDSFSKIKNINFDDSSLLNARDLPKISRAELKTMSESALAIKDIVGGGITALGSGGLAGLAAYGGVGLLGTASTGTAIGALSGAAATNATLAWLGGGSLAAGGFGMAGGMVVLGGIVAGPVLAVGGIVLAAKAEAAKLDAYSNYDKAKLAAEEMKSASVATNGIQRRFDEINSVLMALDYRFAPMLKSLTKLVESNVNYETYSDADKKGVFMAASLAKTLKTIMEAPLIDNSGALTHDSRKAISLGQNALASI